MLTRVENRLGIRGGSAIRGYNLVFDGGSVKQRGLGLLLLLCAAGTISSAQTQLPWSVVSSGGEIGAPSGASGVVLSGSVGQVIVGQLTTTLGSDAYQGFWLPIDLGVSVDDEREQIDLIDVMNYPNPFAQSTTIKVSVDIDGPVTVRVMDLVGNVVRTIETSVELTGGQTIAFDGRDNRGEPLAGGVYFYEVTATTLDGKTIRKINQMNILR